MSSIVHGLLHLPQSVRDLGPLWSHSCFPFENAILKFFHGSQALQKQVQVVRDHNKSYRSKGLSANGQYKHYRHTVKFSFLVKDHHSL